MRSELKRASNFRTLTAEQRAKLDCLSPLSTRSAAAPLSTAEIAALRRVPSLSSGGGWQVLTLTKPNPNPKP